MATATTVSPITTHVLDTSRGCPARGITARLQRCAIEKLDAAADAGFDANAVEWTELGRGATNNDGRIVDLLSPGSLEAGVYRLIFDTRAYFSALKVKSFYPSVSIIFEIEDTVQHYHVPLLLCPFGYSTYRGS